MSIPDGNITDEGAEGYKHYTEADFLADAGLSEDGSCATVVTGTTPLADALAEVDKAMPDGYTSQGEMRPHLSRALWHLTKAVRASLTEFSETDVRALAVTALNLWGIAGGQQSLPDCQYAVLGKARELFGDGS